MKKSVAAREERKMRKRTIGGRDPANARTFSADLNDGKELNIIFGSQNNAKPFSHKM